MQDCPRFRAKEGVDKSVQLRQGSESAGGDGKGQIHVAYDGTRSHKLKIEGHSVKIRIDRPEGPKKPLSDEIPLEKLIFECKSGTARDAVLRLMEEKARELASAATVSARLYTMASWGDWSSQGELPDRPLSSVITTGDQVERVRKDLEQFLSTADLYNRVSAPYHRGYLFYGPPGTGKTSLARALASHFALDLHYLALASVKNDEELTNRVAGVKEGILLLEDIDVFHSTRDRKDDNGVTLSGLLNALDGATTPHGLIVIMTTNDRDVIDEAIRRAGRVDLELELGLIGPPEVRQLFENFYGSAGVISDWLDSATFEVAPATVTSTMLAHIDDAEGAAKELQAALGPRA